MLSDNDKILLNSLFGTEYGQALKKWLMEEIELLEREEEHGSKICDDPLIEDFRTQLGIKIAYKRVLRKPQDCMNDLNNRQGEKT